MTWGLGVDGQNIDLPIACLKDMEKGALLVLIWTSRVCGWLVQGWTLVRAETRWIFAFSWPSFPKAPSDSTQRAHFSNSNLNSNSHVRQNCLGKTNAPASSSGVVHAAGSFPRLPSTSPVRTSFVAIDGPRLGLDCPAGNTPSPPHSIATCAGNERESVCWSLFPFQTTRHRWSRPGISTARPTSRTRRLLDAQSWTSRWCRPGSSRLWSACRRLSMLNWAKTRA